MTEEEKSGSVEVEEEIKPTEPIIPSMEGKEDMGHLHEQIGSLIRAMTKDYDLSVTSHVDPMIRKVLMKQGKDPSQEYFARFKMDPRTKRPTREVQYVHIPEKIHVRNERIAIAIALHEAGHVVSTRNHIIPDEIAKTMGFGALMASVEERPTDQVARVRMPGMASWVDELRRDQVIDMLLEMQARVDMERGERSVIEPEESAEENEVLEGEVEEEPHIHDRKFDLESIALLMPKKGHRFQQLTGLLVFGPHYSEEELKILTDPDVLRIYEKIRQHVEFIEHSIPEEGADEEEADNAMMLRAATVQRKILPAAQELIDMDRQDFRDEEMRKRETRKKMLEQSMSDEEREEREKQRQKLDDLKNKKEELERKKEEIENDDSMDEEKKETAKSELDGEIEENEEEQENTEKEMRDGLGNEQQEIEDMANDIEDLQHEQDELRSQQIKIQHDESLDEDEKKIAMDELERQLQESEEKMRGKQDDLWDKIPDEIKEKIMKMAEQAMKDMEDQIMKEYEGDLSPEPMMTHKERDEKERDEEAEREEEERDEKEREEKEKAREKEREKMEKEKEEIERKMKELAENKPIYEKEFQLIREPYRELMDELDEILNPTTASQVTFTSTGTRLNIKKLFLWSGQRGGGSKELTVKPFETVKKPEARDYSIQLVVDLSSSMSAGGGYGSYGNRFGSAENKKKKSEQLYKGSRIDEAFKATICAAEVLDALGIRVSVVGFQDRIIPMKGFDEKLDDKVRERMQGLVYEVYDSNPGGNNSASYNDDGKCVREASDLLEEEETDQKIMIVLSDGQPAPKYSVTDESGRGVSAKDHLRQTVADVVTFTDQKIVGLGIGEGTDHVSDYYPVSRPNINIENLVENMTEILRTVIVEPHILEQAAREMRKRLGLTSKGSRSFTFGGGNWY